MVALFTRNPKKSKQWRTMRWAKDYQQTILKLKINTSSYLLYLVKIKLKINRLIQKGETKKSFVEAPENHGNRE